MLSREQKSSIVLHRSSASRCVTIDLHRTVHRLITTTRESYHIAAVLFTWNRSFRSKAKLEQKRSRESCTYNPASQSYTTMESSSELDINKSPIHRNRMPSVERTKRRVVQTISIEVTGVDTFSILTEYFGHPKGLDTSIIDQHD